jgi:DNA-binding PadR family transcriptional regulator
MGREYEPAASQTGVNGVAKRRKVNNLLALAILAQLTTSGAMHPYEIANLLRRTGKEQDMNIKWGSFYTVVANLEKHGFLAATGSDRDGRRPERTVYAITDAGRAELRDWLRELVAEPEAELPRFEAALSVIGVLPPDEVVALLETRLVALDADIAKQRAGLAEAATFVPEVFLIEGQYALAMREAEAAWVRELLRRVGDDSLTGVPQWREFHRTGQIPPEFAALLAEADPRPNRKAEEAPGPTARQSKK